MPVFGGSLDSVSQVIAAVAALGTAAYGLVDASKFLRGGVSNVGFAHIEKKLEPFKPAFDGLVGAAARDTLYANWVNGVATPDQKAAAKALIRLGLTPGNASSLADAIGLKGGAALTTAVEKVHNGTKLDEVDLNILGEFDAIVSTILDAAYERADQQYRNAAKAWAVVVAVILAIVGGYILDTSPEDYFVSKEFCAAVLIGLVSTPLAPIAKDLASALTSAVQALQSIKR